MSYKRYFSACLLVTSWTALSLSSSCLPSQQGFTSGGERSGGAGSVKPQDEGSTPSNCTESKLQSVKSVTQLVDQNKAGELFLDLTFLPCPAQKKQQDITLQMDIDGQTYSIPPHDGLSYGVIVNSEIVGGVRTMTRIKDQDIFGKTGQGYDYYRSDANLTIGSDVTNATIQIKMGSQKVAVPSGGLTGDSSKSFSVPVYFKLGENEPVKSMISFSVR